MRRELNRVCAFFLSTVLTLNTMPIVSFANNGDEEPYGRVNGVVNECIDVYDGSIRMELNTGEHEFTPEDFGYLEEDGSQTEKSDPLEESAESSDEEKISVADDCLNDGGYVDNAFENQIDAAARVISIFNSKFQQIQDSVGHESKVVESDLMIEDTIPPKISIEYEESDWIREDDDKDIRFYAAESTTLQLKITEKNFSANIDSGKPIVKLNDSEQDCTWENTPENSEEWVCTVSIEGEGEYILSVSYSDPAGNALEDSEEDGFFYSDKIILGTAPFQIKLYDGKDELLLDNETVDYYNSTKCFTVKIDKKNLEPEQVEIQITKSIVDDDGNISTMDPETRDFVEDRCSEDAHFMDILFEDEADYCLKIKVKDATLEKEQEITYQFSIDKSKPVISVDYGKWTNEIKGTEDERGIKYYNAAAEIGITINEKNFDLTGLYFEIDGKAIDGDKINEMRKQPGDDRSYTCTFEAEGVHTFKVCYKDAAGNPLEGSAEDGFFYSDTLVVDLTKPVITIEPQTPMVENEAEIPYYGREAEYKIFIKETNFNPKDVKVSVVAKDRDGKIIVGANNTPETLNFEKATESQGSNVYEAKILFDKDAIYTLTVEYQDLATNEAEAQTCDFIVDIIWPDKFEVVYDEAVREEIIDKINYRYYNKPFSTKIIVEDSTSEIDGLTYWVKSAEGVSTVNTEIPITTVGDEEIKSGESKTQKYATVMIPGTNEGPMQQINGMLGVSAHNMVGLTGNYVDSKTRIVVDNIAPEVSITYSEPEISKQGINYYHDSIHVVIRVKEANFYYGNNDIKVFINDNSYKQVNQSGWEKGIEDDTWIYEFDLTDETFYKLSVEYKDRSGNQMICSDNNGSTVIGEYESDRMVVDKTAPVVEIINAGQANYDDNGTLYYGKEQEYIIRIKEQNFDPKDIEFDFTATDIAGSLRNKSEYAYQDYKAILQDPMGWNKDTENSDINFKTIKFAGDAIYHIQMKYTDLAGRASNEVTTDFVIDQTEPRDLNVELEDGVQEIETDGGAVIYYQSVVKAKVKAVDTVSKVDHFVYSFETQKGASGSNISLKDIVIESEDIHYSKDGSEAEVEIVLPGAELTKERQLNGTFTIRAVNRSGLSGERSVNKRIVADNIAPKAKVTYTKPKNLVEGVGYYDSTITGTLEIEELNFYAEDVILKINDQRVEAAKNQNNWKQNGDCWIYEFSLSVEGDYIVTAEYTDKSNNKMNSYRSNKMVVDRTDPTVNVSRGSVSPVNTAGGIQYYNQNPSYVVTVKEHNFNPAEMSISILAVGVDGGQIEVGDYLRYLRQPANWSGSGDSHSATLRFETDALYSVQISCKDLALRSSNTFTMERFAVDKSRPGNPNISYSNPVNEMSAAGTTYDYYNSPVTVTVSAEDDISGISGFEYRFVRADNVSGVNGQIETVKVDSGELSYSNNDKTATYSFKLPEANLNANGQLNGTLEVTAINRSMLSTVNADVRRIIVDNINPVVDVEYNAHVNEFDGVLYFDQKINATVTIDEANFFKDDVEIRVVKNGGEASLAGVSWVDRSLDRHVGNYEIVEDGRYETYIDYTDKSSNSMPEYRSKVMVVDTMGPEIHIEGIQDHSANKGQEIGFVITIIDENLNADSVKVALVAESVDEKGNTSKTDMSAEGEISVSNGGKTYIYTIKNLDMDAVYSVSCSAIDRANNMSEGLYDEKGNYHENVVFSVNRKGSTYLLDQKTQALVGTFTKKAIDVFISEINPNKLRNIKVTLFKNDQTIVLKEGTDYKVTTSGNSNTWYQYNYTIDKSVFEEDGVYRVAVYSEDEAGNVSDNTLDSKNVEISFGVDKTSPRVIVANLEERATYPVNRHTVLIQASDNMKLIKGIVYLDGKEYASWNEAEIAELVSKGEDFMFDVTDESTKAHDVKIVMTDVAGNETVKEIKGFYVTTNLWIRYINNKFLVVTTVGGLVVLIGGVVSLFRRRKRKNHF